MKIKRLITVLLTSMFIISQMSEVKAARPIQIWMKKLL